MKAVFFDRDGVVNRDFGYVYQAEDFIFTDGIFELLEFFKKRDYLLLLVTNQSGIGMGYYTQDDFLSLSDFMQSEIKKQLGFNFDEIYFCPHHPDSDCLCRKPKPGMIKKALRDYRIDLEQSILIGDRMRDVEAAQRANVKYKILVQSSHDAEPTSIPITNLYKVQTLKQIPDLVQNEIYQ